MKRWNSKIAMRLCMGAVLFAAAVALLLAVAATVAAVSTGERQHAADAIQFALYAAAGIGGVISMRRHIRHDRAQDSHEKDGGPR